MASSCRDHRLGASPRILTPTLWKGAYDKAQEAADELREQADDLIDDVAAELRFNLRKKDPASRRRIMRTYGVKYRYLKGEPVEAE